MENKIKAFWTTRGEEKGLYDKEISRGCVGFTEGGGVKKGDEKKRAGNAVKQKLSDARPMKRRELTANKKEPTLDPFWLCIITTGR